MSHNGVPPGSGAVVLWKCPNGHRAPCPTCEHREAHFGGGEACRVFVQKCPPCEVIGVRFPTADPDPGRWYRGEKSS